MTAFLFSMAALIVLVIAGAFLPQMVKGLIVGWACLLTLGLADEVKERRRGEIRSDLWEQWEKARKSGYSPLEIALQQFLRWMVGLPSDVSWRAAYLRLSAAQSASRVDEPANDAAALADAALRLLRYVHLLLRAHNQRLSQR